MKGLDKVDFSVPPINFVKPQEYNFILAHISCDFLKPLKLNYPISLQLWVGEIGQKKFDLEYRVVNRDDESIVYAKGQSTQIFFDYKNNLTLPIPKYYLDKILEYADR
jgi:acyl-CoA thioester hydrolase